MFGGMGRRWMEKRLADDIRMDDGGEEVCTYGWMNEWMDA